LFATRTRFLRLSFSLLSIEKTITGPHRQEAQRLEIDEEYLADDYFGASLKIRDIAYCDGVYAGEDRESVLVSKMSEKLFALVVAMVHHASKNVVLHSRAIVKFLIPGVPRCIRLPSFVFSSQ
jgi:hypothetical protein